VTARSHPLFGGLLTAQAFRRVNGITYLVVELPDGSPGTIRADATDVVAGPVGEVVATVFDVDGLKALHKLVLRLRARPPVSAGPANSK